MPVATQDVGVTSGWQPQPWGRVQKASLRGWDAVESEIAAAQAVPSAVKARDLARAGGASAVGFAVAGSGMQFRHENGVAGGWIATRMNPVGQQVHPHNKKRQRNRN